MYAILSRMPYHMLKVKKTHDSAHRPPYLPLPNKAKWKTSPSLCA